MYLRGLVTQKDARWRWRQKTILCILHSDPVQVIEQSLNQGCQEIMIDIRQPTTGSWEACNHKTSPK